MKLKAFADTWRDFSPSAKFLFCLMISLGICVLIFGLSADYRHTSWMKDYSYIPNILAGLTGFLLGVPVALVGFATITSDREEKAATNRVRRLTNVAWDRYKDAIEELCGPKALKTFGSITYLTLGHYMTSLASINDIDTAASHGNNEEFQQLMQAFNDLHERWGSLLQQVLSSEESASRWSAILREWEVLDRYVRLQRMERALEWFDLKTDAAIRSLMVSRNPFEAFLRIHEGPRPEVEDPTGHESMDGSFYSAQYLSMTESIDQYLVHRKSLSGGFPDDPPVGEYEYEKAIEDVIRHLKNVYDLVTSVRW